MTSIKQQLERSLSKALGEFDIKDVTLQQAPSHTGADFASSIALVLAKKQKKNPQEIAQQIKDMLEKEESIKGFVERIEVAQGGFINFFISQSRLGKELQKIIKKKGEYGAQDIGKGKTVVIDYSGPNIAKRFSVGHLRSTVIGQALYNLYKFLGYKVIGDNHLGDWGTQFGMIIAQVANKNLDASTLDVDFLEKLYVEFNKEMANDPELKNQAKFWFKKLEEGDSQAREIWQAVVKTSLREFEKIYAALDIHIDNAYGESFYEKKMQHVLEELEQKHLVKDSEGARVVEVGENMPPAILIKSDGTTTYLLRDLATIRFRLQQWQPDEIIYEVGSDQILHFRQLFSIADQLGWSKGKIFKHVAHGLIRFKEGKMSTRQGKTVKLEEVLEEAIKRARDIIERSETGRGLDNKEKEDVAKAVGIGAIKYFDLSHHPSSDIIFDWEKLFMLEGNSAPYLQYTNARIQSILTKASSHPALSAQVFQDAETKVVRALIHFPDIVQTSAMQYSPNLLANFLFDLAQTYNHFYVGNRVLGSEREQVRLALSQAVAHILQNGLRLLGIQSPSRM